MFHLQYADDTIFSVRENLENAKSVKYLLRLFEVISGLTVNYDKSCVYRVNLDDEELGEIADVMGCQVGTWPIPYLGLKVRG